MRTLFFLLLFINAAFAIYIQSEPVSSRGTQPPSELHPEKIKSLSASVSCLEWGDFTDTDLERAEAAIAGKQLDRGLSRQIKDKATVYWVHIPPLRSKFYAERKMGELRRLGVTTYSRIQDNSKWNNAISMGFFPSMEEADNFMAELKGKGVRSAIIGERSLDRTKFVVRAASEGIAGKMEELKEEFPGSRLKTIKCDILENEA
jgi:hypothetical protein